MTKRVVIDLDQCDHCESCGVTCQYFHHPRLRSHGVFALRERATYDVVCRRCEVASCMRACPFDALERNPSGVLERNNLRCVSCKLCVHACPFGTITDDLVSFYVTPCSRCLTETDGPPPCVQTCARGAIEYSEVDAADANVHIVDDRLAARSRKWLKREGGA